MRNRAERLYELFEALRLNGEQSNDRTKALEVWGKTLDLDGLDPSEDIGALEISRQLALVGEELKSLRGELRSEGYPEDLFRECYIHCYRVINPLLLNQRWGSHHAPHLRGEVRASLRNWSHNMDSEEKPIPRVELKSLADELLRFEGEISKSEVIGERLRSFLFEQTRLIRKAIRDYKIKGVESFHSEVYASSKHAARHGDIVAEEKQTGGKGWEELKKLGGYWQQVAELVSHAETTVGLLRRASDVADVIDKLPML